MSATTAEKWSILTRDDDEIRRTINVILRQSGEHTTPLLDRRTDIRVAFPNLVSITPLQDQGMAEVGEPIHVVGKSLAERGFDFYHTENFPFRRVIVSIDLDSGNSVHFILNMSWSRFLRPGWYDSGGRFTHLVQKNDCSE